MSFHEKSLWLMFFSLVAVFGLYFGTAIPGRAENVRSEHIGLFIGLVVLLVVIQIVGNVVLAVTSALSGSLSGGHQTDERDRLIGLKGTRNGSWVLATGVFFSLLAGVAVEGNFVFTHLLLASWVLAQLVEIGSQLVHYRRGA